jgi:gluconokinase
MAPRSLALSIDIGTSSTRVLLWDGAGREVEGVRAQSPYRMATTPDGGMEIGAEELLGHVAACLDQALEQAAGRAEELAVVGISSFWHALLGLDQALDPVTPIYNWADTRSGGVAIRLRHDLDSAAIRARTGCELHSSYYPAKLVWLRETHPDLFARVARWVSPSEYLFRRLFGESACRVSVSVASGTGLMNQARCEWDEETLKAIGIDPGLLSPIDMNGSASGLSGEFAARWPALRSVPFMPPAGDGACGNVGSGCTSPSRLAINLGTSGAVRGMWSDGTSLDSGGRGYPGEGAPAGLWRYCVDRSRPIIGAAFSDGGIVHAWMGRTLQLPADEELERQIAAMTPGEHGLVFLPFLAGERSLGWNPRATGAWLGLRLDSGPVEMARAAMEAVALQFAAAVARMRVAFPGVEQIVVSGGALGRSPAWTQMIADAIGQPLTRAEEPEASSRGAALLALEAEGLIDSVDSVEARMGAGVEPDPGRSMQYAVLLARQQELYDRMFGSDGETER